jgi:5'-methylthioadenosine phosphorylase
VTFDIDRGEAKAMIASMKVAFISGTSIVNSDLFASWEMGVVETLYGPVTYKRHGEHVLINRHGYGVPRPPHTINHRANIRALADLGFVDVVSVNSVGSLKPELPPGTLVSCSDYVCLQQGPQTFFDDELKGGAPVIDNNLMPMLLARLSPEFSISGGKVYVQMQGPRFETKAEIAIIRHWGDVVGMTAAHEADLCREIGLRYNSFAIVDNYANGLEGSSIDFAKFKDLVRENQAKANRLFARLLEILH